MKEIEELVLVDGSGYIFRAYYALPKMSRSDGLPVNAVFGFCNMLLKQLELLQNEKGGNVSVVIIFDAFSLANFIKDKCPSCRLPIVGIKANLPGRLENSSRVLSSSSLVRVIIIYIMTYMICLRSKNKLCGTSGGT